ncbi:hypothetical protein DFH06DRAFT_1138676 [Mycena polygramma]|nr:hypothetical protein DFH06DRAFT_1138676 [Mycena polygramma]
MVPYSEVPFATVRFVRSSQLLASHISSPRVLSTPNKYPEYLSPKPQVSGIKLRARNSSPIPPPSATRVGIESDDVVLCPAVYVLFAGGWHAQGMPLNIQVRRRTHLELMSKRQHDEGNATDLQECAAVSSPGHAGHWLDSGWWWREQGERDSERNDKSERTGGVIAKHVTTHHLDLALTSIHSHLLLYTPLGTLPPMPNLRSPRDYAIELYQPPGCSGQ